MTADLDCIELVELATDYLEHELDDDTRAEVEAHLTSCGYCRAYLDQMRLSIRLTGSLQDDDVPPAVLDALGRAFRER